MRATAPSPLALISRSQQGIPASQPQSFAELVSPSQLASHSPAALSSRLQIHTYFPRRAAGPAPSLTPQTCSPPTARISPPTQTAEGAKNDPKIVDVDFKSICTHFHISGTKTAISEIMTGSYAPCRSRNFPKRPQNAARSIGVFRRSPDSEFEVGLCCDFPGYILRALFSPARTLHPRLLAAHSSQPAASLDRAAHSRS
jgi:hypothetical protein